MTEAARSSSTAAGREPAAPARDTPGRYEYDGGGYFSFPDPVMLDHIVIYWQKAIAVDGQAQAVGMEQAQAFFDAARELIVDYGQWQVDKWTIGQLKTGQIPADLFTRIVTAGQDYMIPFFPPGPQRALLLRR